MKKYSVLFKGNAYSIDFYANNKKELREKILNFLGVNRLPAGTQIF